MEKHAILDMFQVNGLTTSCEVWGYGRSHGRGISLLAGTGYNSQKPKLSLDSTATCTSIKKNSSGCTSDGMNCHTYEDSILQLYQKQCTALAAIVHCTLQQWLQLSAVPLPWLEHLQNVTQGSTESQIVLLIGEMFHKMHDVRCSLNISCFFS